MNSEGLLGTYQLVEKLRDVDTQRTFIIKDVPDARQEVFGLELWNIKILSLTPAGESRHWKVGEIIKRELKVLFNTGIVSSFSNTEDYMKPSSIRDNFIENSF